MTTSRKSLITTATLLVVAMIVAQYGSFKLPILTGSNKLMEQYEAFRAHIARDGPFDMIVFGNSVARRGIDPDQLSARLHDRFDESLRIYNFGVGGTTTPILGYVVDVAYGVDQPPTALLVVGLRMAAAWTKRVGDVAKIQVASPYGAALTDPVELRGRVKRWLLDHVAITGLRYSLKSALLGETEEKRRAGFYDGRNGFRQIGKVPESQQRWDLVNERMSEWAPTEAKRQILLRSVRHLQKRAAEVWLVQAPVHPRRLDLLENPEASWQQSGELIAGVAEEAGTHSLLIPKDLVFSAEDFADTTHLVSEAAARYTAWLGDSIDVEPRRAK